MYVLQQVPCTGITNRICGAQGSHSEIRNFKTSKAEYLNQAPGPLQGLGQVRGGEGAAYNQPCVQ